LNIKELLKGLSKVVTHSTGIQVFADILDAGDFVPLPTKYKLRDAMDLLNDPNIRFDNGSKTFYHSEEPDTGLIMEMFKSYDGVLFETNESKIIKGNDNIEYCIEPWMCKVVETTEVLNSGTVDC
jgi:hypothetical protein